LKICWDNLEGLRLNKNGNFSTKDNTVFVFKESCNECGDPYLTYHSHQSNFCSMSCAQKNKPLMTVETRKKISMGNKGKFVSKKTRLKLSYRHISNETRRKQSESQIGPKNHRFGKRPHNYKGVHKFNIPLYDTYALQISYAERVRRDPNNVEWLQVRCAYCGKWFMPKCTLLKNRIAALDMDNNSRRCGESRFYCSNNCKKSCPIFGQHKYPKGFKPTTSREVQPQLRQLVFERDNYTCQKCGKTVDEIQIHCHHIDSVSQNPIESADIDNCITFCKDCHKWVHRQDGCKYHELRCNKN